VDFRIDTVVNLIKVCAGHIFEYTSKTSLSNGIMNTATFLVVQTIECKTVHFTSIILFLVLTVLILLFVHIIERHLK